MTTTEMRPTCMTCGAPLELCSADMCSGLCGDCRTDPDTQEIPDEPELPEIPATRRAFLASLQIDGLEGQACDLEQGLDGARAALMASRQILRERTEQAEIMEARLSLSEEFRELKNDTARKAWLMVQREDNPELRAALYLKEQALRRVEQAEVDYERVSAQHRGTRLALELAREQLHFMAGEW